eukprot:5575898-Amphidinium_carterae.1
MTVRFDELVYGTDSWRHKSETLLQYTLRKQPQVIEALRKLDRPVHAGPTNAPHAFWGEEEEAEPEWSEWPEAWWTPEEELACEEPSQEIEQSDADNVLTEAEAQDMFFTGKGTYAQARSAIAAQRTSRGYYNPGQSQNKGKQAARDMIAKEKENANLLASWLHSWQGHDAQDADALAIGLDIAGQVLHNHHPQPQRRHHPD